MAANMHGRVRPGTARVAAALMTNALFEELSVPQRRLVIAPSRTSGPSLCRNCHSPQTPVTRAAAVQQSCCAHGPDGFGERRGGSHSAYSAESAAQRKKESVIMTTPRSSR